MAPGPISGEWPSIPPQQPQPIGQSTPVTIGLAVAVLGVIVGGAVGWGRFEARGEGHERRLEKAEKAVEECSATNASQNIIIAGQGKDIGAMQTTVERIDRRTQRWEESGSIRPARQNGGQR